MYVFLGSSNAPENYLRQIHINSLQYSKEGMRIIVFAGSRACSELFGSAYPRRDSLRQIDCFCDGE